MKGVEWMTLKAPCSVERIPCSLPVSWVQKKKELCLEEPHDTMGLVLCSCHPFTAGPCECLYHLPSEDTLCEVSTKENENMTLKKDDLAKARSRTHWNTLPYCLGLMGGSIRQVLNEVTACSFLRMKGRHWGLCYHSNWLQRCPLKVLRTLVHALG